MKTLTCSAVEGSAGLSGLVEAQCAAFGCVNGFIGAILWYTKGHPELPPVTPHANYSHIFKKNLVS